MVYKKPNFLVLGASRSGTTLLHSYFLQHPQIYVPKNKQPEPHFFLKGDYFNKGEEWYHENYFSSVENEKAIGEISTSYLFGEKVAERIAEYNPDLKFIVLLREPGQRAYSNYWHSYKNGFEKIPFDDAIRLEEIRMSDLDSDLKEIAPFAYVGRSMYHSQFQRYLKYFERSQFYVCQFETFIESPIEILNQICAFLGVNDEFEWNIIKEKQNASNQENRKISFVSKKYLKEIFENENSQLAELFNLNLERWK